MRPVALALALALAFYSCWLVVGELRDGTEAARMYLEDPAEPVLFGHVNTAVSSAILWTIALVFAVSLRLESASGNLAPREGTYLAGQVLLFLFLAADERFRVVPAFCAASGVPELWSYAGLAGVELAVLLGPGRLLATPRAGWIVASGALFLVSMGLDQVGGARFVLRGSLEELPKVWSGALFLSFAWLRLDDTIERLTFAGTLHWGRRARRSGDVRAEEGTLSMESRADSSGAAPEKKGARSKSGRPGTRSERPELRLVSGSPRKLLSH